MISSNRRWTQFSIFVALGASLGGCTGLSGSHQSTAPAEVTIEWTDALQKRIPSIDSAVPPLRDRITEPELQSIIAAALDGNLDLKVARARIREARLLARVDVSRFRPQLATAASITDQTLSENGVLPAGRIPGFESDQTIYEAAFDASWEIDLFGRRDITEDLGELRVLAQQSELASVEDSLVVEVVRRYVEYQQAAHEAALLDSLIDRQITILAATQRRFEQGEASDVDVKMSEVELLAIQARRPAIAQAQTLAQFRLAILAGQSPGSMAATPVVADSLAKGPWTSVDALDTTHTDALRRRPDIRLAEIRYAQAVRESDLATLEFYPRITLFGSIGPESTNSSTLTDAASLASALGGLVEWALFDGGRRRFQREASLSQTAQAELAYRDSVLNAAEDIESNVVTLSNTEMEYVRYARIAETLGDIFAMTERRFVGGELSRVSVLQAEREWLEARIVRDQLNTKRLLDLLALEKSLGAI
ncbi:MAG: TolC family protein [Pseudomonadota bacterium]